MRRTLLSILLLALLALLAACGSDPLAPQKSPDGRFTLTPSVYERSLVRLTIRNSEGATVDQIDTRDSDVFKWIAGWADARTVVFQASDTGTLLARHHDGTRWTDAPVTGDYCLRLRDLFSAKYGEKRTLCTE